MTYTHIIGPRFLRYQLATSQDQIDGFDLHNLASVASSTSKFLHKNWEMLLSELGASESKNKYAIHGAICGDKHSLLCRKSKCQSINIQFDHFILGHIRLKNSYRCCHDMFVNRCRSSPRKSKKVCTNICQKMCHIQFQLKGIEVNLASYRPIISLITYSLSNI